MSAATLKISDPRLEQPQEGDIPHVAWAYAKELYQASTVLLEALEVAREFHFDEPRSISLVDAIESGYASVSTVTTGDIPGVRFVLESALIALDRQEARKKAHQDK